MGRYEDRIDLAGEYKWNDLIQVILLILFLAVWVIDSFFLRYSTSLSRYVPIYIRIPLGTLFILFSGYLAKKGLDVVFGKVREAPSVIREGIFMRLRHPVYLGAILLYFGFVILTLSVAAAILFVFICVYYHLTARYEEKLLIKKFDVDYKNYIKKIPMWVPWLVRSEKKR